MNDYFFEKLNQYVTGHVHKHVFLEFFSSNKNILNKNIIDYVFSGYILYRKHIELFRSKKIYFENYFKEQKGIPSFELFNDDVQKALFTKDFDLIISRCFSTKHRKLLNRESEALIYELVLQGVDVNMFKQLFSKKIALIKDEAQMTSELNLLFSTFVQWNKSFIINKIKKHELEENVDYNIIYDNDNKLYLKINSFKASKALGSRMWCIVRKIAMFDYYRGKEHGYLNYVFAFDFSKHFSDRESQIAFLYNLNYDVLDAYLSDDSYSSSFYEEKKLIQKLLLNGRTLDFELFFDNYTNLTNDVFNSPYGFAKLILKQYKYSLQERVFDLEKINSSYLSESFNGLKSIDVVQSFFMYEHDKCLENFIYLFHNSSVSSLDIFNIYKEKSAFDNDYKGFFGLISIFLNRRDYQLIETTLLFLLENDSLFLQKIREQKFFNKVLNSLISNNEETFEPLTNIVSKLINQFSFRTLFVNFSMRSIILKDVISHTFINKVIKSAEIYVNRQSLSKTLNSFIYEDYFFPRISLKDLKRKETKSLFTTLFNIENEKDAICFWSIIFSGISELKPFLLKHLFVEKKSEHLSFLNSFQAGDMLVFGTTGRGRSFLSFNSIIDKADIEFIIKFNEYYPNLNLSTSLGKYLSLNKDFYVDFVKELNYSSIMVENFLFSNIESFYQFLNYFGQYFDKKQLINLIEKDKKMVMINRQDNNSKLVKVEKKSIIDFIENL